MDNRLLQLLANVPEQMLQTAQPGARAVTQYMFPPPSDDPLSHRGMNREIDSAQLGRAMGNGLAAPLHVGSAVAGGAAAAAPFVGAPELTPLLAGAAYRARGLGGQFGRVADTFEYRNQALKNLFLQRMQRGQSLPPGLLDQ